MSDPVVRLAARGDGVTASGAFVAGAAPGDVIEADGSLTPGPHRRAPPCRHFGMCGGCQLQHIDDAAYAGFVVDRIATALTAQDLALPNIRLPHLSPPASRRRVAMKAVKRGKAVTFGFNEGGSHRVFDMRECPTMHPRLFALVAPLRSLLSTLEFAIGEARMTLVDQGVDLSLSLSRRPREGGGPGGRKAPKQASLGLNVPRTFKDRPGDDPTPNSFAGATRRLTAFAAQFELARLALDEGDGADILWEPEPVTVTLGNVPVPLPPDAFLQATADGEAALVAAVREAVGKAGSIADLFAGLGTFSFAVSGKVHAVEGARDALLALQAAANRARRLVAAEHRDLFRRPLAAADLARFEAVILDPPRAGAKEQCAALAQGEAPVIAYVSCNPATFARDARTLVDGGYTLDWVQPVGQFRWSTHVELAASFSR